MINSWTKILDYHRSMIMDKRRVAKYREAIAQTVREGDIVLDLGSGTGLLAYFACQSGANRVYAIEQGPIIEAAKSICHANGFHEQVTFFNDISTLVSLPERVDVLITETIGNFGVDEGILTWLADAQKRFLKPGGKIIPELLMLFAAPVELHTFYEQRQSWKELDYLDYSSLTSLATNNSYNQRFEEQHLLGKPSELTVLDLYAIKSPDIDSKTSLTIQRQGILHGIGGWFAATLINALTLSNRPPNAAPSWSQVFFPLAEALPVLPGDQLDIHIQSKVDGTFWRWRVAHYKAGVLAHTCDHSTFLGSPLSIQQLAKQRDNHKPKLNHKGEIDDFIMGKMDATHSLNHIAGHLVEHFPDRFVDRQQALAYVKQLSRTYSS